MALQSNALGQKTGTGAARRHDRVPATPIFDAGIKEASTSQLAASMVQDEPGLHLICKVSDGLEEVPKAEELKPDSICTPIVAGQGGTSDSFLRLLMECRLVVGFCLR